VVQVLLLIENSETSDAVTAVPSAGAAVIVTLALAEVFVKVTVTGEPRAVGAAM
jgi:hypothetical protein